MRTKADRKTPRQAGYEHGQRWIEQPGSIDCTDKEIRDYADLADDRADWREGFLEGVASMLAS